MADGAAEQSIENTEEELKTKQEEEGLGIGALLTPEGVVMMGMAGVLDLVGIILVIFGLDDFGITDVLGIIFISAWMYLRSSTLAATGKTTRKGKKGLAKLFRGRWGKYLTPIVGELIPYVGALPFWTIAVYYEITSLN